MFDLSSRASDGIHLASTRLPLAERSNTFDTRPAVGTTSKRSNTARDSGRYSSLYDAEGVSDASITSITRASPRPITIVTPATTPRRIKEVDLRSESPLSRLGATPFLYGHGTELHPIAERRSISTLRTASYSTSDLSSLGHCPVRFSGRFGPRGPIISQGLRRRQSFSLNDIDHVRPHALVTAQNDSGTKLEPVLSSTSASSVGEHILDDNTHKYPFSPPYSPHTRRPTPKDLFSMIESHDQQTDRNDAAYTWLRLVRRSRHLYRDRMRPCHLQSPPPSRAERSPRHGDTQSSMAFGQDSSQMTVRRRCELCHRKKCRASKSSRDDGHLDRCRCCSLKKALRLAFCCGGMNPWGGTWPLP
ncbi:hypothetical protein BJ166DRAFT_88433 [Pestalotiopsis sp. NC0098]|nr:hypothetical protein BJ166DRAFT_88433 [Pestalotiopsis sp. NC0098]